MNRPARLPVWAAPLLAVAGFVLVFSKASAQTPSAKWLQGTHFFRYILHERQFTPLQRMADFKADPEHTILIVLGETDVLSNFPGSVGKFVQDGGALLVATDRPLQSMGNPPWYEPFGVEVVEQPVLARREGDCYQGIRKCPFALPIPGLLTSRYLFQNLRRPVATNCSGFLRVQDEFIERIASMLPPGSKSQNARTDWENLGILPFALAGIWGSGRALFLADHSIFINNMMLQEDLGNVGFTCNCLDWLRDGEERRDRVLLYDEGEVVTDFNVPAMIPPPRLPDDPITLVNQVITGLEDENMHNRLLLEHLGFERITRWTIVALTTLLAVYLFWRLVRSRYRQEAAAPLLAPTLSRFAPVGVGLSQRHKALLAEGNLWEPARALARDFFENAIGRPEPPATLPPFQASMGWPARRFVEKLVQHLWRVAYGAKPERIAPAAFAHLAAQLDELRAAVADGSLRFQTIRTA